MTASTFRVFAAVTLLVLSISRPVLAQTTLQWNFATGEKLGYAIKEKTISKMEAPAHAGGPAERFDLTSRLVLDTIWTVRRVDERAKATVVITVDRVQFTASGKGGAEVEVTYDSRSKKEPDDKPAQGIAKVFGATLGTELVIIVDPSGQIMQADKSPKLTAAFDSTVARELAGFFGDAFTAQGFASRLTTPVVRFPAKAIEKGDEWHREHVNLWDEKIGSVTETYRFLGTQSSVGGETARVEIRACVETKPTEKETPPALESSGKLEFSLRAGKLIELNRTNKANLTMPFGMKGTVEAITAVDRIVLSPGPGLDGAGPRK
jgi:hypothetical protein